MEAGGVPAPDSFAAANTLQDLPKRTGTAQRRQDLILRERGQNAWSCHRALPVLHDSDEGFAGCLWILRRASWVACHPRRAGQITELLLKDRDFTSPSWLPSLS